MRTVSCGHPETFSLTSMGMVNGISPLALTDPNGLVAGDVYAPKAAYKNSQWWTTAVEYPSSGAAIIRAAAVNPLGALSGFVYTNAAPTGDLADDHNVIELSIPWSTLAGFSLTPGSSIDVHTDPVLRQ